MNDKTKINSSDNTLHLVYDFGLMPHVNNYRIKDDQGLTPKNPLRLMFCNKTKLLQLEEMPDRNDIYRDYDHFSSASSTNASHLKSIANDVNKLKDKNKTILEVGCNDATLLRELDKEFNVYGIDPAINVYEIRKDDSFKIIHEFFDKQSVERIKTLIQKPIDIIIGINVFAHNNNYIDMFSAIYDLLSDNGYAHIEVAYAAETIMSGNFDTIYHEHYCNYTLTSLKNILDPIRLSIIDVEVIPTQGGSLRVKVAKKKSMEIMSPKVTELLDCEARNGYADINFYKKLSKIIEERVNAIKRDFVDKNINENVLLVGVPARGVITSNVCGFSKLKKVIAFDDTLEKQGKVIPGTNIDIKCPTDIDFKKYKIACVLAWTYKDDLIPRLKKLGFEGQVFIPFPNPVYYTK
jgi:hypothetical protein